MRQWVEFILMLKELWSATKAFFRKKELDEAAEKAAVEGDQSDVEKAVSGHSGVPSDEQYDG